MKRDFNDHDKKEINNSSIKCLKKANYYLNIVLFGFIIFTIWNIITYILEPEKSLSVPIVVYIISLILACINFLIEQSIPRPLRRRKNDKHNTIYSQIVQINEHYNKYIKNNKDIDLIELYEHRNFIKPFNKNRIDIISLITSIGCIIFKPLANNKQFINLIRQLVDKTNEIFNGLIQGIKDIENLLYLENILVLVLVMLLVGIIIFTVVFIIKERPISESRILKIYENRLLDTLIEEYEKSNIKEVQESIHAKKRGKKQ